MEKRNQKSTTDDQAPTFRLLPTTIGAAERPSRRVVTVTVKAGALCAAASRVLQGEPSLFVHPGEPSPCRGLLLWCGQGGVQRSRPAWLVAVLAVFLSRLVKGFDPIVANRAADSPDSRPTVDDGPEVDA